MRVRWLIKRVPLLYRIASGSWRWSHSYLERYTDYFSRYWRSRGDEDIRSYWDSRTELDKNEFLLSILRKYEPSSILEVGCNCGNKLFAIAREYPEGRLSGIDINPRAVRLGAGWLAEEGITNVELAIGRAEDLTRFPDGSYDIVFSWAVLIYPRPSVIRRILADMARIARKAIVLLEIQSLCLLRGSRAAGFYHEGHWKRDYVSLLGEVAPTYGAASVRWISQMIWRPGGGCGAVIEAARIPLEPERSVSTEGEVQS